MQQTLIIFQGHRTIYLSGNPDETIDHALKAPPSPHPPRRMVITVAIPQTHVLNTASLTLVTPNQPSSSTTIATVGHPLMMTLRISHTRRWAPLASVVSAANVSTPQDPIDFVYTIDANPETWLLAGQRRAHFFAKEDEELEWPVMLVPLRQGHALLPNIEIRPRIKPRDESQTKANTELEVLNCETDYLSYGESIVVVPDVRSSTVGVGDMSLGSPRSVVWLESVGQ